MTDDERDEFFHRVEVTEAMTAALASEVAAHTGQAWKIDFNVRFQFHLVDNSHAVIRRDYGWFYTWAELMDKMHRIFPDIPLDKRLLPG